MVKVELVYVAQDKTITQQHLNLTEGETVLGALIASGIFETHPETKDMLVGIFSKPVPLDTIVKDGDRLEIYRPLSLDPKEKRRLRAKVK